MKARFLFALIPAQAWAQERHLSRVCFLLFAGNNGCHQRVESCQGPSDALFNELPPEEPFRRAVLRASVEMGNVGSSRKQEAPAPGRKAEAQDVKRKLEESPPLQKEAEMERKINKTKAGNTGLISGSAAPHLCDLGEVN